MSDKSSIPPSTAPQFSVRWLLLVMTVVSVASAAIMSPQSYWAPVLTNLSVTLQLLAVVGCVYARGESRAYAVGFAVANGFFLFMEYVPAIGRPLIHDLLPWAMWGDRSPLRLTPEHVEGRAHLGLLFSGLLYGYACAVFACRLYRRHGASVGAVELDVDEKIAT